jgi:Skp family chaperone for outer membrane proteins
MWQAAVGTLVGYLFAVWWVRRDARKEVAAVRGMYQGRLEARNEEISKLRDSFDQSQRAVAAHDRRARYLESAIATSFERNGNTKQSTESRLSSA